MRSAGVQDAKPSATLQTNDIDQDKLLASDRFIAK
jgi:hypothetical protein